MTTTRQTTVVIFGASGDLTNRKLIPALYNLHLKHRLPEKFSVVGVSRSPFSHEDFRSKVEEGVKEFSAATYNPRRWARFAQCIYYHAGDSTKLEDVHELHKFLNDLEDNKANRLYYLSTAPSLYIPTAENLGLTEMADERNGWRRLIVEKPFGVDLASAQQLNWALHKIFHEEQIYRIDHYLGKETAQNILFLRFANTILEPVWNRNYVDHIQITVSESVDVGHRAGYYDQSGVVRDMFQNHLLQLLALVTKEPPSSLDADALRNEKSKVFAAIPPINLKDTVRAQYDGYCGIEGVAPNSQTPTYAALKLYINNWRWEGVPFYLRSGKAMAAKTSEINVVFRRPPLNMFENGTDESFTNNVLTIRIQPDEGTSLKFEAKMPDANVTRSVVMDFDYSTSFGECLIPDAYERLLHDALNGDATLFTRSDNIEYAWKIIDPVIHGWETSPKASPLVTYPVGSWGPKEADDLMGKGRVWLQLEGVDADAAKNGDAK
ncbi:MAG: glucose-6-phosphate dehydrogenase [Anaerolineae bacterium]|nr:glucose-6-phosphate dehydrogenase [Anaerolineae bacterium]